MEDRVGDRFIHVVVSGHVFKRAFNNALDLISKLSDGDPVPSESALSAQLGVSRTTVRKVLAALAEREIVRGSGRERFVRSAREVVA